MNKRLLIIVATLLAVCIIVGASVAIITITSQENVSPSVDYHYCVDRENCNHVIIAPKGMVCEDTMMYELDHIDPYTSEPDERVSQILADGARTYEASDISQLVYDFMYNIISSRSEADSSNVNAGTGYPDYYAGQYIMRNKEENVDAPYWGDGTTEQYKLCIRLVKGKEAEAQELMDYLKEYEDSIVYKYTERSYSELCDFVFNIAAPKLKELGVQLTMYGASQSSDSVAITVIDADFDKACPIIAQLVEEYGIAVGLTTGTIERLSASNRTRLVPTLGFDL